MMQFGSRFAICTECAHPMTCGEFFVDAGRIRLLVCADCLEAMARGVRQAGDAAVSRRDQVEPIAP